MIDWKCRTGFEWKISNICRFSDGISKILNTNSSKLLYFAKVVKKTEILVPVPAIKKIFQTKYLFKFLFESYVLLV